MIEIDLNKSEILFSPVTVEEQVIQNIRMILSTTFFEVPYHRDFGLNATYLDKPIQLAQMLSKADIVDQIEKYEPRARVREVIIQGDALNGYTNPIVRITLND